MSRSEIFSAIGSRLSHIGACVSFLSRLPFWSARETQPDCRECAYGFAPAGLILALPCAFALWLASWIGLPPIVSASLAWAAIIAVSGALHEDGLADMADGFWGATDTDKKLEIMSDSRIGTYGVTALIFSITLRVFCLAHVLALEGALVAAGLFAVFASLSRGAMVAPWALLPCIERGDAPSLCSRYGKPDGKTLAESLAMCAPLVLLSVALAGLFATLASLALGALAVLAVMHLSNRHIGGIRGDCLGAAQQFCEIGLYLGLISAL